MAPGYSVGVRYLIGAESWNGLSEASAWDGEKPGGEGDDGGESIGARGR